MSTEVRALKKEIKKLNFQNNDLNNIKATYEQAVQQLEKREASLAQEVNRLRNANQEYSDCVAKLTKDNAELRTTFDEGSEFMDKMEDERKRMQSVIDDVEEKNRELQVKLTQMTKTCAHLKSVAKDLTAII